MNNKKDDSRRQTLVSLKKSGLTNMHTNSNLIYISDNNPINDKQEKKYPNSIKFNVLTINNIVKSSFVKNPTFKNRLKGSVKCKEKGLTSKYRASSYKVSKNDTI